MTIDEKLSEIGIKRILIVDDKKEHISAAKEYFEQHTKLQVDYAQSAKEAIEIIQKTYASQKYDLVFSDLEMEESKSGIAVITEAFRQGGLGLIVTGRDEIGHHGPTTTLITPKFRERMSGTKADSKTWKLIGEKTADYICSLGKEVYDSLSRPIFADVVLTLVTKRII